MAKHSLYSFYIPTCAHSEGSSCVSEVVRSDTGESCIQLLTFFYCAGKPTTTRSGLTNVSVAPRAELRRAYEHLTSAHELAQSIARPGVRASRIQRELNAYLEGHGLRGTPYGVGHGIGLRICELPTLFVSDLMDEDAVLLEGEVIALEPETTVIVDDREVVLKIEDNFIVTSAGLEKMTIVAE